jgi:hypothetical protein
MDPILYSSLFAAAGAVVTGGFTLAATLIERRWGQAYRDIRALTDQVEAYHQLESLYKDEMAMLTGKASKTVMEQMRKRVAEHGLFVRPTLTSEQARKIRANWVTR